MSNLEHTPVDTKTDAKLGEKRKLGQMEQDKENDGATELNSGSEKRAKPAEEAGDAKKEIQLNGKKAPEEEEKVRQGDDEEEEVIDTSNTKKKLDTERQLGKRVPKKPTEDVEEEKVAPGTLSELIVKAAEEEDEDGEDEDKGKEFALEEEEYEKMKQGDEESEEDNVSLEEESIGELQNEDDGGFDLNDYLKFREQEDKQTKE